jgi:hypothetical protein
VKNSLPNLRAAVVLAVCALIISAAIQRGYAQAPADDAPAAALERRVYEGVASWRGKTIGTLILLEGNADSAHGWIRLNTYIPIESGKLSKGAAEFRAGGNTYSIDEIEKRMTYSGPEGEGRRLITPLVRWTGVIHELLEQTQTKPAEAKIEVAGRTRTMAYGTPSLWKQQGPPFEKFPRLEELLSKEVSVWVADADLRNGRLVVIEEPAGMDIPLKAPKVDKKKNNRKK